MCMCACVCVVCVCVCVFVCVCVCIYMCYMSSCCSDLGVHIDGFSAIVGTTLAVGCTKVSNHYMQNDLYV